MRGKSISDPVHGFVDIDQEIMKIVSSPVLQRLRYIRQTGMTYLVYPGMTHSRFEHCLGTYYLVQKFLYSLKSNSGLDPLNEAMIRLSATAGLLHDVGHMPLSHTFEKGLEIASIDGLIKGPVDKKWHVTYGSKIIMREFSGHLEKLKSSTNVTDSVAFVSRVINNEPRTTEERIASNVISSFIDADRSDYLLRDSYYAGTKYGVFDLGRIMRVLDYLDDSIVFKLKGLSAIEEFLLARRYMYTSVYFHEVVASYNALASFAIYEMLKTGIIDIPDIDDRDFTNRVLNLTDIEFFYNLRKINEKYRNALVFREGYTRLKEDPLKKCKVEVLQEEMKKIQRMAAEISLQHNGDIIVQILSDFPYETVHEPLLKDEEGTKKMSEVSWLMKTLSNEPTLKGIVFYRNGISEKEVNKLVKDIC